MNFLRTTIATATLVALAGTSAFAAPKDYTISLQPQNTSGESGTATFTPAGGGVKIVIALHGAPADAQPTHIHEGTCANINKAPAYPLNNIVEGKSTTVLKNVKMDDLKGGKYALNVHKSTSELGTYVACGDIK